MHNKPAANAAHNYQQIFIRKRILAQSYNSEISIAEFGSWPIFTNWGDTEGIADFLTYTIFLESGAVISAVYIAADPDNTSPFEKAPNVEVALDHWSRSETFPSVDGLTLKKTYSSEI